MTIFEDLQQRQSALSIEGFKGKVINDQKFSLLKPSELFEVAAVRLA